MSKRPRNEQPSNKSSAPSTTESSTPWTNFHVKPISPEQKQRFRKVVKRKILATRFYHQPTCQQLGIDNIVRGMLLEVGIRESFLDQPPPATYPRLVYEFLSSLERIVDEEGTLTGIRFRLANRERSMTLRDLSIALGSTNPAYDDPPNFGPNNLWRHLTRKDQFNPSHAKASDIVHIAIRYVHRVLVSTFLPKSELGNVGMIDLGALFQAVLLARRTDRPINLGGYFVDRIDAISAGAGPIHFGGMITLIAHHLQIPLDSSFKALQEANILDLHQLRACRFTLRADPQSEILLVGTSHLRWCYLPDPARVTYNADAPCSWWVERDPVFEQPPPLLAPEQPVHPTEEAAAPPPSTTHGEGSPSSSAPFDFSSLQSYLAQMRRAQDEGFDRISTEMRSMRDDVFRELDSMRADLNTVRERTNAIYYYHFPQDPPPGP